MPINISASNYINTAGNNPGSGQGITVGNVSSPGESVTVSIKGLDLKSGQTLSGQIVEIDGKDIKLLLSNNQTINARLEGNINALLGQMLSFEVKNTEDGITSLRPLYTNLNNSQNVSNALNSAGLPITDKYVKMVSSMMDENMPINKQAIHDMAKQINSFQNANPDTVVKLTKLGLDVNELTINQFENYKGFENKISGNVDTISKGLSELIRDSLSQTAKEAGITDITPDKVATGTNTEAGVNNIKQGGKNLLSAFLSAITGQESDVTVDAEQSKIINETVAETENAENEAVSGNANGVKIDSEVFDTAKSVLEMVNTEEADDGTVSGDMKAFISEFAEEIEKIKDNPQTLAKSGTNTISDADISALKEDGGITSNSVLKLAKNIINELGVNQEFSLDVKEKLLKLLNSREFGSLVKDNLTKQLLLKPQDVVSSKNVEELYNKIVKQTNQAIEILNNAGAQKPDMLEAANNIRENVAFMNELNHVVTYVQLPLLMNNKSAHGDLYVYTNKKSLKNNDGNVSALLHLDMENLGPMDIYVALTNRNKLNTHFYLKDEATIDFIEAHMDFLNKRLTQKGYNTEMNVSVKDPKKGKTNMTEEFFKDDPKEQGMTVVTKMSFDVRA